MIFDSCAEMIPVVDGPRPELRPSTRLDLHSGCRKKSGLLATAARGWAERDSRRSLRFQTVYIGEMLSAMCIRRREGRVELVKVLTMSSASKCSGRPDSRVNKICQQQHTLYETDHAHGAAEDAVEQLSGKDETRLHYCTQS